MVGLWLVYFINTNPLRNLYFVLFVDFFTAWFALLVVARPMPTKFQTVFMGRFRPNTHYIVIFVSKTNNEGNAQWMDLVIQQWRKIPKG
jgi:hypothetical protein